MRILIIGVNYSPEQTGIGPYTAALATYLAHRGHGVDVLTGLPSYPEWRVHSSFRRVIWSNDEQHGVRVHRRWHYVPHTQSAVRRLAYETTFLLSGLSFIKLDKPDLVVGVIPTLSGGVLARLAARRFRTRYALIFQDLMGPAASQTGVAGASRVAKLVTSVERHVAAHAAAVGIVAEGFRPHLEKLGVDAKRIHRVRNWARVSNPTEDRETTRKQLGLDETNIACIHAGNMGHKQGLENIVECARYSEVREPNLRFIFLGDGNQRAELEELAAGFGLLNLQFLPLQSEEAFANILAAADILLINQRAGVTEMALPSKLTSYLAAGRPVVAAVESESETARELMAAKAGIVVPPDDPQAVLSALKHLSTDQATYERLGSNGKTHAQEFFSASAALFVLEEFLTHAV